MKLGQNFLVDESVLKKIDSVVPKCNAIVEVGGGNGVLTKILLNKTKNLLSIEIDSSLMTELIKINSNSICYDALKYDFTRHKDEIFVSNLPYQISVQLLLYLFEFKIFTDYYVMVQKEVADRMSAKTNTKQYGKMSVLSQESRNVTKLFDVLPTSFKPSPKVHSSFIHIKQLEGNIDWKRLSNVLSLAFNKRRKILKNSLEGIDEKFKNMRPQELSVEEWKYLSVNLFIDGI